MKTTARRVARPVEARSRWPLALIAVTVVLLIAWIWLGSLGSSGRERRAGDPAWDRAYDGLLDGAPSSGGVVVRDSAPGRKLVEGLLIAPRQAGGAGGYVIATASDPAVLAQAKLRPGDVLLDIDGRPLDPARLGALAEELAPADAVEVTFERDGQLRKRLIDLRR